MFNYNLTFSQFCLSNAIKLVETDPKKCLINGILFVDVWIVEMTAVPLPNIVLGKKTSHRGS